MTIKDRFEALLREMNQGIYEKESEIALSMWAAVAGEHNPARPSGSGQIDGGTSAKTGFQRGTVV